MSGSSAACGSLVHHRQVALPLEIPVPPLLHVRDEGMEAEELRKLVHVAERVVAGVLRGSRPSPATHRRLRASSAVVDRAEVWHGTGRGAHLALARAGHRRRCDEGLLLRRAATAAATFHADVAAQPQPQLPSQRPTSSSAATTSPACSPLPLLLLLLLLLLRRGSNSPEGVA